MLEETSKRSASSIAADAILERIYSGQFRPGEPLRQQAIAQELSVSRMPVRDALRMLCADGLVTFEENCGFRVATISSQEIRETANIRYRLESLALEKAITNFSDLEKRKAEDLLKDLTRTKKTDLDAHLRFHNALYAPCGMPRLLELINQNIKHWNRFLLLEGRIIQNAKKLDNEQHEQLFQAVVMGDNRLADAILYSHTVLAGDALITRLSID